MLSPSRVRGYGGEVGRAIAPEVAGRPHICRIETMAVAKSDWPSRVVMDALDCDYRIARSLRVTRQFRILRRASAADSKP